MLVERLTAEPATTEPDKNPVRFLSRLSTGYLDEILAIDH
jgi:hypothetical protein